METGLDISVVNRWDLDDIRKAEDMLRMKDDYEEAYSGWQEKKRADKK